MSEHIAVQSFIGFKREATAADRNTAPGSGYTNVGNVESFTPASAPDAREVWGPAPETSAAAGKYVRLEIIETRRSLDFTAAINSASSLFWELLFGTAASPATTYKPGAVKTLRGWVQIKQYDHEGSLKNTLEVFGRVTATGVNFDGGVVAWTMNFQEIYTNAAAGTLADMA